MTSDFFFSFGHLKHVIRFGVLLKLPVLLSFWHHSIRGGDNGASLLPSRSRNPDSPVHLCWCLRGQLFINDGWGWRYWFPINPPAMPPSLRRIGVHCYCSLHHSCWCHGGGGSGKGGATLSLGSGIGSTSPVSLLWPHPSMGEVCLITALRGWTFRLPQSLWRYGYSYVFFCGVWLG